MMKRPILFGLLLSLTVGPVWADSSHDRALRQVREGTIQPLSRIVDQALINTPGDLLEAELEQEHGRLVYELKILTRQGQIRKIYYDAHTGTPLTHKDRP